MRLLAIILLMCAALAGCLDRGTVFVRDGYCHFSEVDPDVQLTQSVEGDTVTCTIKFKVKK